MTAPPQGVASRVDARRAVREALNDYATERMVAARRYGPEFEHLWTIASRAMLGGKFIRPMLLVEVASAFDRDSGAGQPRGNTASAEQAVVAAAAAVELLHYAFVLHDDVIDGDLVRRGRPNLIGAVVARHPAQHAASSRRAANAQRQSTAMHWGASSAILMGDLVLSGVYQSFARLDVPHATRERLFELLGHTIDETVAGEFADVGLGDGCLEPDLATILAMSANKTATYTFEFPLRIAAILSGADLPIEERLAAAGRHLGLAFQLQDDLLSVFGDPHRHGKDADSDLREGKQTALIAYARMTSAWHELEPLLGRMDLSPADADVMRACLDACGARGFVEGLIEECLAKFRHICEDAESGIPSEVRSVLLDTAVQLARKGVVIALTALETFTETSHRAANEVIGSYSTSFGLATRLLGARHRQHVRNVYALVRVADEIVDGVAQQAGLSLREQRDALARFREETERAMACGYSADVIIHAFAGTARLCGFGEELTGPFFDAMAMDLESPDGPGSNVVGFGAERHDSYVFGSAEVVGLMCVRVFARDEVLAPADIKAIDRGACQLGAAFQDINFLRDLQDDLDRGRSYLDAESTLDEQGKDEWVAKVRKQLDDAALAIPLLPKDARAAVRCAHGVFTTLVNRIDDARVADLYEDRLRVPDAVKAWLAVKAVAVTRVERAS